MSCYQFAAGMFEEEIIGEKFPGILLEMSMAFSNIDMDDKLCVNSRNASRQLERPC